MTEKARFVWNGLITADHEKCGAFYSALLDWTTKKVDMGASGYYTVFQQDGKDVAGMMHPATEFARSRPPFWSAYIAVDDIDACAARVVELGGEVIEGPTDIPAVARVCMLTDPVGAPVCLVSWDSVPD